MSGLQKKRQTIVVSGVGGAKEMGDEACLCAYALVTAAQLEENV